MKFQLSRNSYSNLLVFFFLNLFGVAVSFTRVESERTVPIRLLSLQIPVVRTLPPLLLSSDLIIH